MSELVRLAEVRNGYVRLSLISSGWVRFFQFVR